MRKGFFCIAVTLLILGGMFWASPYRQQMNPAEVVAMPCQQADLYNAVTMRGKTELAQSSQVYPPWPAVVQELYVSQGEWVAAGDPLMLLEPSEKPGQALRQSADQTAQRLLTQWGQKEAAGQELLTQAAEAALSLPPEDPYDSRQPVLLEAPMDGLVMEVFCQQGQTVSPIAPCAMVGDMDSVLARVQVGEGNLHKISPGMEAEIQVDAFPGQPLTGRVESVAPYAQAGSILNQNTEIVTDVLVSIENSQGRLRPGYSAAVTVKAQRHQQALLLPYDFVGQDRENREYVMTVWQGRARKKLIQTGMELEQQVEVLAGLEPGELVLQHPEQLYHGQAVRQKGESLLEGN